MSIQQDRVIVNGTTLFCERAGDGETLVLVHGGGGDRRHWDEQFPALAEHFDVIRYDLRGYGQSDNPVEGEPYRHQDDLKALLDALGVSKAHIAGYSLGCQVVIDAYTLYPELFHSLIAVGPYALGHASPACDALFGGYAQCGEVFKKDGPKAAGEAFANIPAFNPDKIAPDAKKRVADVAGEYGWWWADHDDPLEFVSPPGVELLADINVPVLTITAEFDAAVCLEVADLLEQQVPQNTRVDIPGATHFMLLEKPDAFNKAVSDFVTRVGRA